MGSVKSLISMGRLPQRGDGFSSSSQHTAPPSQLPGCLVDVYLTKLEVLKSRPLGSWLVDSPLSYCCWIRTHRNR